MGLRDGGMTWDSSFSFSARLMNVWVFDFDVGVVIFDEVDFI